MNGKEIFSDSDDTPDKVDQTCKEMFGVLGKNSSIAAARLLNQAGVAGAWNHFISSVIKDGKVLNGDGTAVTKCIQVQMEIQMDNDNVSMIYRCLAACKEDVAFHMSYIGVEAKYTVPRKELEELGAKSPEELKDMEIEKVAPNAKALYSYTKACLTEDEARSKSHFL